MGKEEEIMDHVVELYPHQEEFLFAPEFLVAIIGGIGSGKTWSGAQFAIKKLQENPETVGFIGANTVTQLHDATLKTFFEELEKFGIIYHHNQIKGYIDFPQITYREGDAYKPARIKCASLENFNALRGPEYGWAWFDETRDTKEEAFDVILGRMRCKKSIKIEVRITTSPSGYNWLYDRLVGKKRVLDSRVIHARSRDNLSLPENYLLSLESTYDSKFSAQELEGKFVNLTSGKIYHAFDRDIHVEERKIYGFRPKIGVDFNQGKMCAVVAELQGNHIHFYQEYYCLHNTFSMASELYKDFKGNADIIPDSTGKAKKSSSKKTDHQILKDRCFAVIKTRNPFIEDRWNTMNRLFQDNRITISENCPNLIEEFERADLENGLKAEGKHYHISVGAGYVGFKYFPYRIRRNRTSKVRIW